MSLITIAVFCLIAGIQEKMATSLSGFCSTCSTPAYNASLPPDIDSLDRVIFDFDQFIQQGTVVEIPVYIMSDDVIFALDFSMLVDTGNLQFESVVDHAGDLQYAAYLNPNDLKLRFTSNSFTPYLKEPNKIVSVRFDVQNGTLYRSDLEMLLAYLNGEKCTAEFIGGDIVLGNREVEISSLLVTPNPASSELIVNAEESGVLSILNLKGQAVLADLVLDPYALNKIDIEHLPRGSYVVTILSTEGKLKSQKIILQ